MAETMNVVVKEIVIRNCVKQIYVANGMIYNIVGYGESAGAQLTPIDEATDVELYNALGPDNNNDIPLAASLGQMADFTEFGEEEKYLLEHISPESEEAEVTAEDFTPKPFGDSIDEEEVQNQNCENIGFDTSMYKVDNSGFDSAVDFLCSCSAEDFLELVRYAKAHSNKFFALVPELTNIVNADDCYCTAIIKLSRPLGETVKRNTFEYFERAIHGTENDEERFSYTWMALKALRNMV